jgi:hypothetical protein
MAPPSLSQCLVGAWKGVTEDVANRINNAPVAFNGPGNIMREYVSSGPMELRRVSPKPQPGS